MNTSQADELQQRVWGFCMVLAPCVLLLSSVGGWSASERWAGIFQVYAMFLFIPATLGLSHLLWERRPRLAVGLRMLLIFGCVGGICYGLLVAIEASLEDAGVGQATLDEFIATVENELPLVLNLPGLMFPLSLAVTGITLWRTRAVPPPAGILLAVAAVSFPIGRIGDIDAVNILVDVMFIAALGWIALPFLRSTAGSARVPVVAKTA